MRALILDADDGPTEAAARRTWIGERFPSLTASEADDLAGVPAERFGVYTETIFAGERSMLRWAFPMSMAAIGRMLRDRDGSRPEGHLLYDFVREMHQFGPWRSHSIRDLATCFRRFVVEGRMDLVGTWPGLVDLVAFEQAEVGVFFAADEPIAGMRPDEWAGMSVEALLMVPIILPRYLAVMAASFDVLAWRDSWNEAETLPDAWPAESKSYCVCGREPESLRCRWVGMDAASFQALLQIPRGEAMTVNDLARVWLSAQPEGTFADESAAFAAFCEMLAAWARAGVVMRPATCS